MRVKVKEGGGIREEHDENRIKKGNKEGESVMKERRETGVGNMR